MAAGYSVLSVFACYFAMLSFSAGLNVHHNNPIITSAYINQIKDSDDLELFLIGYELSPDTEVRLTPVQAAQGEPCTTFLDIETRSKWSNGTAALYTFVLKQSAPKLSENYICVKQIYRTKSILKTGVISTLPNEVIKWVHQGDRGIAHFDNKTRRKRRPRSTEFPIIPEISKSSDIPKVKLFGLRVESADSSWSTDDDGVPLLLQGTGAIVRLFGTGLTKDVAFVLTRMPGKAGQHCEYPVTEKHQILQEPLGETSAILRIELPQTGDSGSMYYLCYKPLIKLSASNSTTNNRYIDHDILSNKYSWKHLGNDAHLGIRSYKKILPLWASLIIILHCLFFSSLFSGLNLGLMSLDRTDLKIICNTGTEKEQKYARAITPVRSHGNYLLCSILLGNVMVNSTFTILLDDLTSGLIAVITSTLAIVIFGEITPQAICSRHGLAIGAKTIFITKCVMALTCPLSYPISKLLDWLLGEEIGAVYTRERLKELVKLTTEYNDLQKDEVNIISGALELSQKIVKDIMTKLDDIYMLSIDAILDFETVSEIMKSGFSRVPVYEGTRSNIVSMLYIKDLALIDPDDNTPLKTHCQFYQNNCFFVFEDTKLDVLFKQLKDGVQGHMAFVRRVNNEGEGDPFYETIGLVTLEDVIEELIQAEINDETDVYTDNKTKRRRKDRKNKQDFSLFAEKNENQKIHISPQLTLAAFQFLSTSVDAFKPENISESVLRRLLKQDVFCHIKMKDKTKKMEPFTIIYEQGKPVDYFVLILEGRVEVTVGRENLIFESGPFTYFGSQALIPNVGVAESPTATVGSSQPLGSLQSVNIDSKLRTTFVPDYGVRAVTEVSYMKVKRSMYLAAKRATLMEWSKKEESTAGTDAFDDEMEKLMHSLGGEDTRSQGSPEVTRTYSQHPSGKTSPQFLSNGPMAGSEPLLTANQQLPYMASGANNNNTLMLPSVVSSASVTSAQQPIHSVENTHSNDETSQLLNS
ncbi:unextended protein-like [Rhodnius prolixus]|uniref:unextended protein-like n=1 Tax=Rhodnius prolixus TaxID=13249 RepID=UPI003D18F128